VEWVFISGFWFSIIAMGSFLNFDLCEFHAHFWLILFPPI